MKTLWKAIKKFLKELNRKLPFNPAIHSQVYKSRELKTYAYLKKKNLYRNIIAALFIRARKCKQFKCPPINELISKMCHINTMKNYSATKRN